MSKIVAKQPTINHYDKLLAHLRLDLLNRDALISSLEETIKHYQYNNNLLIKKVIKLHEENEKYRTWIVNHFVNNK